MPAHAEDRRLSVVDPAMLVSIERSAGVRFMDHTSTSAVEGRATMTPEWETRRALRALRKAFANAVLEDLRYGLPVIQ
jgi:hypothetical protein